MTRLVIPLCLAVLTGCGGGLGVPSDGGGDASERDGAGDGPDGGGDGDADADHDASGDGGPIDGDVDDELPEICRDGGAPGPGWQSEIVHYDAEGRLVYEADGEGNRVPDFSHAGYHHGEVPIPQVPVVLEIAAVDGDNTDRLQAAVDEVGEMPLDATGHRGALLLRAGEYRIEGTLRVPHDGVVLRGEGDGPDPEVDTILLGVGDEPHQRTVLEVGSGRDARWGDEVPETRTDITSAFVPVASAVVEVDRADHLSAEDQVAVVHPCTAEWLEAIDHGATGSDEPWSVDSQPLVFTRRVTDVSGNSVTLDVPLFNHLDRSLSQSYLYIVDRADIVTEVGVERLRVDIETRGGEDEDHAWNAIGLIGVEDAWVADVTTLHFGLAGVLVRSGSRITVTRTRALDPVAVVTGSRMYNFNVSPGQQILFTHCEASNGRHHFVSNGTSRVSGIVFHRCTSRGAYTSSEGHRRWSQGMLFDVIAERDVRSAGLRLIGLYNREDWGTGHGWALAHSVAWNYDVGDGVGIVQRPPTAQNYAIGGSGEFTGESPPAPFDQPEGFIEGVGRPDLVPESLYESQLFDRLCR